MTQVRQGQVSFAQGEISRRLDARDDLALWRVALRYLRNFVVWPQGGITRTPGTRYIYPAKSDGQDVRMLDFEFSDVPSEAYAIEFGGDYARFYQGAGIVVTGPDAPYELAMPFDPADIWQVQTSQSNDVLFMVTDGIHPQRLQRNGHTDWSIDEVPFTDGPYMDENGDDNKTMNASGATGNITVAANFANAFKANDVGRWMRIWNDTDSQWGYGRIKTFTDDQTVVLDNDKNLANDPPATKRWRMGAFGGDNGFPAAVSFFEERSVWSGVPGMPISVFCSAAGEYFNMAPTRADDNDKITDEVVADDALVFTVNASKVNRIHWVNEDTRLLIGTVSSTRTLGAASDEEQLSPDNPKQRHETHEGTAQHIQPIDVESNVTLFAGKYRRRLFASAFDLQRNGQVAGELTETNPEISQGKFRQMAWQDEPHKVLWMTLEDGGLRGLTYKEQQAVSAWHRHQLGAGAFVQSVTTISGDDQDYVWLAVKRTVQGQVRQYIERMEPFWELPVPDDEESADHSKLVDAWYVACGLRYQGEATSTLTGLDHLEGETVDVWADRAYQGEFTVTGGAVDLGEVQVADAIVGLAMPARMVTLGLLSEILPGRVKEGHWKAIRQVSLRIMDAMGGWCGQLGRKAERVLPRDVNDAPVMLAKSGEMRIDCEPEFDNNGAVFVEVREPTPFSVTGLGMSVEANEK